MFIYVRFLYKFRNVNPVNKINENSNRILLDIHTKEEGKKFISTYNLLNNENNEDKQAKIISHNLETIHLKYNNLTVQEILRKTLPKNISKINTTTNTTNTSNTNTTTTTEQDDFPTSFEMIGKIAHINLREKYLDYKYLIGELILDKNQGLKTVINKTGKIDNVYRTYKLELLAGEACYEAEQKEGSCIFYFDIRKVYWCSRLGSERDRLLTKIKKGEILLDAFCGVGPLALRAAKQGVKVYASDLNPDCYESIVKNLKKNKINMNKKEADKLQAYNMDAREFIRKIIGSAKTYKENEDSKNSIDENTSNNMNNTNTNNISDISNDIKVNHIYMNLPKDALEFLDVYKGLFNGCKSHIYSYNDLPTIHVYCFAKDLTNSRQEIIQRIKEAMDYPELNEEEDKIDMHNIRDISPKKYMFCVSFKVPSKVAFRK